MATCVLCAASPLFQAVQRLRILTDSKCYVDSSTRQRPSAVVADWQTQAFPGLTADDAELWTPAKKQQLRAFVDAHLAGPGAELADADLAAYRDFHLAPAFIANISNAALRPFAMDVHRKWAALIKHVDMQRICSSCESTLLAVDNDMIVTGVGSFESHYLNAYFVLLGLLASGLHLLAKNTILNFIQMVEKYGFVPAGMRTYYLCRSHPPYLTLMVRDYVNATNDTAILARALPALDKEYDFWMRNRSVTTQHGLFNLYNTTCDGPRPEAFFEDTQMANKLPLSQRAQFHRNVAAADESGWIFSSRWFTTPDDPHNSLLNLTTTTIIPIDLQAIMSNVEYSLSNLYLLQASINNTLENKQKHDLYLGRHHDRVKLFNLFYSDDAGSWIDLSLINQTANGVYNVDHRPFKQLYASELLVFWSLGETKSLVDVDWAFSKRSHMWRRWRDLFSNYPAGLPTSTVQSDQLWDSNNTWAPMQFFAIRTLSHIFFNQSAAQSLAQRFIDSVYCTWTTIDSDGHIYDHYNASTLSQQDTTQPRAEGFAWTNGVVLHLLQKYSAYLKHPQCPQSIPSPHSAAHYLLLIVVWTVAATVIIVLGLRGANGLLSRWSSSSVNPTDTEPYHILPNDDARVREEDASSSRPAS